MPELGRFFGIIIRMRAEVGARHHLIALRPVEVESTDYAQREYGATPEQISAFADATEKRYRRLKRSKRLVTVAPERLEGQACL